MYSVPRTPGGVRECEVSLKKLSSAPIRRSWMTCTRAAAPPSSAGANDGLRARSGNSDRSGRAASRPDRLRDHRKGVYPGLRLAGLRKPTRVETRGQRRLSPTAAKICIQTGGCGRPSFRSHDFHARPGRSLPRDPHIGVCSWDVVLPR